ncbi:MAG: hypothetical protein AAGF23_27365, partial [Acidobacteriota bacterium]
MRLFIATPSDQSAERQRIEALAERVNQKSKAQPGEPRHLEVVDWHRTVGGLTGLPETVAFRNLDVDEDDIFVGTGWLGFDGAESADGGAVCTERDVELAYNYWKTLRRPRAFFMRCMRLPASLDDIDSRRFDRLTHFYQRFASPEKNRFGFHRFQGTEQLESLL